MKKTQQLSDLPVRYQRKGKHWIDTYSGETVNNSLIHTKTLSYKKAQEEKIVEARWDLKN